MDNMFEYLRILFAENEEEDQDSNVETKTQNIQLNDPVVYEEINEMMEKNEVEIVGVEDKIKEAIKQRVEEKVAENQTGNKVHTNVDHEIYEQVAKMFEDAEKEAESYDAKH